MKQQDYLVITFSETTTALYMERICKADGKDGRLIPLPRQISAGCGLAWATTQREWEPWETYLREKNLNWEAMVEVRI